MRPAWRLATSSLSARRSRTALLIAAVALSSALISAVACAMASMHEGLKRRIESTVGAADIRVQRVGREALSADILTQVERWPEATLAVGRGVGPIALANPRTGKEASTVGNGIMPDRESRVRQMNLTVGRIPERPGEVLVDSIAARDLDAKPGDRLDVQRFGDPISLTVVGVVEQPGIGLGVVTRPETFVTLDQLGAILEKTDTIREIDVLIRDPRRAEEVVAAHEGSLGRGVLIRPASKISSGLDRGQQGSRIGLTIASALAMLSAAFIIMTGLTTGVTERLRELAMVRCIGGTRFQLAESQLVIGAIIGGIGAVVGVPLGVAGAYLLVRVFPEHFPAGFQFNSLGIVLGLTGSLLAGLLGAVYPAVRAARTSPLEALAARATPASVRGIAMCAIVGLLLTAVHLAIFASTNDADQLFALDVSVGLPAVFTGYFLLAVPVLWVIGGLIGPALSDLLGIPPRILVRTVHATPYRFGFTAGAMSLGLALLVAIWTNGSAIDRDWLNQFKFPDAFAAGLSIGEQTQERLAALPFVKRTTPITVQNFRTDAFGLRAVDNATTSFIAFDPDAFLGMAKLTWLEGDPETARKRLIRGGAVIVAREFRTTRGLGVGNMVRLLHEGTPYEFEIVGVVSSPGLEIVSNYFEIGDEYLDIAVNAVFGSRDDLVRLFNNTSVRLVQIDFKDGPETAGLTDEEAIRQIHKAGGSEVLDAGSGRQIIREIKSYIGAALYVFSLVAVAAMLVACFGVANLIVAGIQARQYEFGVLRAIGAGRGLVARMVLGEAILMAVTACITGTVMGAQASWAGQRMYEATLGILLSVRLPMGPTAAGWATVTAITVGAALPAILTLNRRTPRELLGVVRG